MGLFPGVSQVILFMKGNEDLVCSNFDRFVPRSGPDFLCCRSSHNTECDSGTSTRDEAQCSQFQRPWRYTRPLLSFPVHQMIQMKLFYHVFAVFPDLVRHLVQIHGIKHVKVVFKVGRCSIIRQNLPFV